MNRKSIAPGRRPTSHDKLIQEHVHDPYQAGAKPREPTACPECGAVFAEGRWQWLARPDGAHEQTCPACRRIHDHLPEGYVRIDGAFAEQHRDDILHLLRNIERKERAEHPLQRIMAIADDTDGLLVTTTDVHLANGIGRALESAYKGELECRYSPDEKLVRVHWQR